MKLLIVRHGDPDYERDSLTPKGWREAEYLSRRLENAGIKAAYVSPLGRAKDTASLTLKKIGIAGRECLWLREFDTHIWRPDVRDHQKIAWDWLPQDWTREERFFSYDQWYDVPVMAQGRVKEEYDWVVDGLDQVLKDHGYVRDGHFYRAVNASNDAIAFFCHFGVECVLLSHLLNISPMVLWHGFCAPPSSVTTLITEERRQGIAYFRMNGFADISHLYANDEPPSFAARFCETYENSWERHDD
ncbi:putative phosphoglycerate mutase [Catenibacillus scindens]|uniref:Putative phosphoglycerate mutase n=1 Tax=Catenibacillus scindens TaxID=673271 RepID=A0A7W8M4B7_9FIRM|nr:histidine phosphatase family protein [Catenibacillus scindens]MBB5263437.1 putative phosphoglycerate mutase [Catenibacillus scindens]